MYSKDLIDRLALSGHTAQELKDIVDTRLCSVESKGLGRSIPVSALVVAGEAANEPAVIIHLDGGVGDRQSLVKRAPIIAALVATGVIPDSIHISFSGGSNLFYTNAWESWIVDELPQWANDHLNANIDRDNLFITGISGGGHGALKVAFKQPDRFKAVAAMEPVVLPSLDWPEQHTRASWWMLEASARAVWGEPFPESFLTNHPPNLVLSEADAIRASGLDIYLEAGDEDLLNLQDGADFLHRLLWERDIPHEFHQVRWADHGGNSIDDRFIEAMAFLAASHAGGKIQPRDIALAEPEQRFVDYILGGGPNKGEPPPEGASPGTAETELTVMAKLWEPLRGIAEARDPDMRRQYGVLPNIPNQTP